MVLPFPPVLDFFVGIFHTDTNKLIFDTNKKPVKPMPLTVLAIKNAKSTDKPQKLSDGGGLHLLITLNGSKLWRLSYRFEGKQGTVSLGSFDDVSLEEARAGRAQIKKDLKNGIDPKSHTNKGKKRIRSALEVEQFEALARAYLATKVHQWTPQHGKQWIKNMQDYAFKTLGAMPIRSIKPADVLAVMREMEALEIYETRDRLLQGISSVFKYGIALELCESNPTDIRILLKKRPATKNFPCIPPTELPAFLTKLDELERDKKVTLVPMSALRFLMLTSTRTSEVRFARWADIDFDKALWTIPAEQAGRKGTGDKRKSHAVPLSAQAVSLLQTLKPVTGKNKLIFTNRSDPTKPISENTILKIIDLAGYKGKMTGHGFRSLCRTILSEMGFRFEVLEAILSHSVGDATVAAYARSQYIEERRPIMQQWANYLDGNGKVVPLKAVA